MVVPDSGFITFNSNNILHDWLYREHIGYMPQIGRYPENMTIGQVLDMMKDIRSKGNNFKLDEDLVNAFKLPEFIKETDADFIRWYHAKSERLTGLSF